MYALRIAARGESVLPKYVAATSIGKCQHNQRKSRLAIAGNGDGLFAPVFFDLERVTLEVHMKPFRCH